MFNDQILKRSAAKPVLENAEEMYELIEVGNKIITASNNNSTVAAELVNRNKVKEVLTLCTSLLIISPLESMQQSTEI